MPNVVKQVSVLMKMSFTLEPPHGKELKGSIYKKYMTDGNTTPK